jgi:hypothetical protein
MLENLRIRGHRQLLILAKIDHTFFVICVSCIYSEYHGNAGNDEDEGHQTYIQVVVGVRV